MAKELKYKRISEIPTKYEKQFPHKCWQILRQFLQSIEPVIEKKELDLAAYYSLIEEYAALVLKQLKDPRKIESYHKADPDPYLRISVEVFRPLINFPKSTLQDEANIREIEQYIANGENVVLFANHQIEADPQILYLLLEKHHKALAEQIIFVAGARVLTDPLAVPFSHGFGMLSVFSKRYFESHQDRIVEMKNHNNQTILVLSQLLDAGGKIIFIAPSGGRDRPDEKGVVQVAPFDPQSTELLYLLGKRSKSKTHFFPLATSTHDILPPPETVQVDLGERRISAEAPIHIHFGKKIDMENFPTFGTTDKKKSKQARAEHIWSLVCDMYARFPNQ